MANIVLQWTPNITASVVTPNGQRAYKRQRNVGGTFVFASGFSPANDLPNSAITTTAMGLLDNVVYEFQIANICTVNGPTFNDNGIQEGLKFACITPTQTSTDTTVTASVNTSGTDIIKVRFTLYDSAGTTPIPSQGPFDIDSTSGSATKIFTSLSSSTQYVVKVQLIAYFNQNNIVSTLTGCQISSTTAPPATCPSPLALTVT